MITLILIEESIREINFYFSGNIALLFIPIELTI